MLFYLLFFENMLTTNVKRDSGFFEYTGKTLVLPITYSLHDYQKDIIRTVLFHNTLISLPSGLGKSLLASVITFNFHRWFPNGKIVVLSQIRSYLNDQINAYNSYTTLSDNSFTEILVSASDDGCRTACEKSIILSSPQKFLTCLEKNLCPIQNLILFVILESSKITKCEEYVKIAKQINFNEIRTITFIDPVGTNSKVINQALELFCVSKIEIKSIDAPEIKKCTFIADIESIFVDITQHIMSIKDAFYTVYEKYGKKLKDAKIINGNVASLSRAQLQKSKDKFLKNPPYNLSKAERDDFVDSMMMCAFLCHGIELLHNWGVRAFYRYLFDCNKEDELKNLIQKDEHLMEQMNKLDDYLKNNGKSIESTLSRIIHPKFLKLKSTIYEKFSDAGDKVDQLRIIVLCPMECVIDDIERLFCTLPDNIRCQFVKTKAKYLSDERLYKETIENFVGGVINVLVITNLVEEIMVTKSSLIISLEPIKALFKLSDPRFHEITKKCLFILTKGTEENKFTSLLHEKRHEHKPIDMSGIQEPTLESTKLFPEGFDPEFENTSVREPKKNLRHSPHQKSLLEFFDSKLAASSPALFECGPSSKKSKKVTKASIDSPSIFADDFDASSFNNTATKSTATVFDSYIEDPLPYLPEPYVKPSVLVKAAAATDVNDSFDDLIFDFTCNPRDVKMRKTTPIKNPSLSPSLLTAETSPVFSDRSSFSWSKRRSQKTAVSNSETFENSCDKANTGSPSKRGKLTRPKKSRSCAIGLDDISNVSFVDDLFSDSSDSEVGVLERDANENTNQRVKSNGTIEFSEESFGDFIISERPAVHSQKNADAVRQKKTSANSRPTKNFEALTFPASPKSLNNNDPKMPNGVSKKNLKLERRPEVSDLKDQLFDDISSLVRNSKSSDFDNLSKFRSAVDAPTTANAPPLTDPVSIYPPKSMSATFDTSSDFSRLITVEESCSRSRIPDFSLTEIPSEIFDDFVPASPPPPPPPAMHAVRSAGQCDNSSSNTSPILFSLKKPSSNRKLFVDERDGAERSASLKFDSFYDASEIGTRSPNHVAACADDVKIANEVKVVPSTPPTRFNDCDSIVFDDNDDIFVDDITAGAVLAEQSDKVVEPKTDRDDSSSRSPSLFDLCRDETANKSSYVDATITVPHKRIGTLLHANLASPVNGPNRRSPTASRTSTPLVDTPKSGTGVFRRRRSTPLFDESDNHFGSPAPSRPSSAKLLRPALRDKIAHIADASNAEQKKRLFGDFAAAVKRRLSVGGDATDENVTTVEDTYVTASKRSDDVGDDDFPWLKNATFNDRLPRLPHFKKPDEPTRRSGFVQPATTPGSVTDAGLPASPPFRRKLKKRTRLKRNLAQQFIDAEAEVTDDDDGDGSSAEECVHLSDDSFIDDDATTKTDNVSKYLKSINFLKVRTCCLRDDFLEILNPKYDAYRSPNVAIGKFRIPVLSERQLQLNVYSQAVDPDQTYENDSFCVDEDDAELEDTYLPSVLTQMEERLNKRKKPKTKQFKRIRMIEDSSPDSPDVCRNQRKRIKCFSSDSEDISKSERNSIFSDHERTMSKRFFFTIVCTFLIIESILLPALAAASAPKYVMNGSLYGKRNSEADLALSKALRSMCYISYEACSEWFPNETK